MQQVQCDLCGRRFPGDDAGAGTCPSCGFAATATLAQAETASEVAPGAAQPAAEAAAQSVLDAPAAAPASELPIAEPVGEPPQPAPSEAPAAVVESEPFATQSALVPAGPVLPPTPPFTAIVAAPSLAPAAPAPAPARASGGSLWGRVAILVVILVLVVLAILVVGVLFVRMTMPRIMLLPALTFGSGAAKGTGLEAMLASIGF